MNAPVRPRRYGRWRRLAAAALGVALLAAACGATPSAAERVLVSAEPTTAVEALPFPAPTSSSDQPSPAPAPSEAPVATTAPIDPQPTATDIPAPTPLPLPSVTADVDPEPTSTPTPTPTSEAEPTATPRPATPTPSGDPTPTSTATAEPTATVEPTVEGTPTPTPTPTPGGPQDIAVRCEATSESLILRIEDNISFRAIQDPVSPELSFKFNHGDGSINLGSSTIVRYRAPGDYVVTLGWTRVGESGTVPCGTVSVTGVGAATFQPRDYVGLEESEASALAASRALVTRVARRDGEQFPGTADFRRDRINFEIDNGVVTIASLG